MSPTDKARGARWIWLALALLMLTALVLLFVFNPAQHAFYPFCFFYRMTGWECPGCGGLRAAHQLLHGNVVTAFRYNPVVVAALPVLLLLLARRWVRGPGNPMSHRAVVMWTWMTFCFLIVFWVVRNLPIEFFQLPAR